MAVIFYQITEISKESCWYEDKDKLEGTVFQFPKGETVRTLAPTIKDINHKKPCDEFVFAGINVIKSRHLYFNSNRYGPQQIHGFKYKILRM